MRKAQKGANLNRTREFVQRTFGQEGLEQFNRQANNNFELPPKWIAPDPDPHCVCAGEKSSAPGFFRYNNKCKPCGACDLGHWISQGLGLPPHQAGAK